MRSEKYIIKHGNCWQICPFQFPEDELEAFQMGVRWEDMDTQVSSGTDLLTTLLLTRVFYRAQSSRERNAEEVTALQANLWAWGWETDR